MKMRANGSFHHEFMVEGMAYEALFSGNEFYLRIVVEKCHHSHNVARIHDPSYGWYHDDDSIRYIDLTTANKNPIKVMREMDRFICKVLAATPSWFLRLQPTSPTKFAYTAAMPIVLLGALTTTQWKKKPRAMQPHSCFIAICIHLSKRVSSSPPLWADHSKR